jgi:hypothetical protein
MQRESPTDATVTTHSSIITNVTVVPEVSAETVKKMSQKHLKQEKQLPKEILNYKQSSHICSIPAGKEILTNSTPCALHWL